MATLCAFLKLCEGEYALASTGDFVDNRLAQLGASAAAIFHQKGKQAAHSVHIGEISDVPAFAFVSDQAGAGKNREVGRHGVLADHEGVANFASRHAVFTRLDQKAKSVEARRLAQRGEGVEGIICIHISRFIDLIRVGQRAFALTQKAPSPVPREFPPTALFS